MGKIADLTYQGIRDRILSGEYPPGAHLREKLVEFIPNRGAYVTSWSLEDVEEIYTLRSLLEGQAAFRAAAVRL